MILAERRHSNLDQIFVWYMVFGLIVLSGGIGVVFSPPETGTVETFNQTNNTKRLMTLLSVYMVSVLFLVLLPSKRAFDIVMHPLILLVLLLPIVSVSWSAAPELSGKRAIAHALTVVFVIAAATRMTLEEFFRTLLVVLAAVGTLAILLAVAMPSIGISQEGANAGSWHGGFGHKSKLGRVSALALGLAIFFPAADRQMRWLRWYTITIFAVLLILSHSRLSWGVFAGSLIVGMVFKVVSWRLLDVALRAFFFLALFSLVVFIALALFEPVVLASGRDLTFSGRTTLWSAAISVAEVKHPFLGSGYGNFWTRSGGEDVFRYIAHWGELPGHGHNGYLDAWLELGVVGLATLVLATLAAAWIVITRVVDPAASPYWFLFVVIGVQFLLINVGGTLSFKHSEIFWVLFLAPLIFRHQR